MSGNNKDAWDKFLNGGSSHYNFSYRQERDNSMPNNTGMPSPAPMPVAPTPVPVPNTNARSKKNKSQKIMLPALKGTVRGLKGGARRRRHTHRGVRKTHRKRQTRK
jgi:hypothetical protein